MSAMKPLILVLGIAVTCIHVTQVFANSESAPEEASDPTQESQQDDPVLEEITVVARRISENLQDVPISITVMDSDFINGQGLYSVAQALALTPTASFQMLNKTQFAFSLRGVSSQTEGAAGDSSVATIVDEVVFSRDFTKSTEFFDVNRIEVLRGPQGTSFGRNATAGALHILTNKPTSEFESRVELELGGHDLRRFDGVVNGSLSDQWAGRLAVHYRERDGYTEDLSTGRMLESEQNTGLRGQLLFTPSDDLDVLFKLEFLSDDDGINQRRGPDCTTLYLDIGPLVYQEPCDIWKTDIVDDVPLFLKRDVMTASAKVGWDFNDSLTLTSITGYIDADSQLSQDSFGTPYEIVMNRSMNDAKQFTQEFRVDNNRQDSRFHWLAGVFYLHDNQKRNDDRDLVVNTPLEFDTFQVQTSENTTDSLGIYGEIGYDLTDRTNFTVGGRWSKDKKDFHVSNSITGPLADLLIDPNDNPISEEISDSWSEFTPSASINHHINDDVMVYFLASKGYKAGGFNGEPATVESALTPYDPETVVNLEVGLKAEWFENRLRTNVTLFNMNVSDLQVISFTETGAPIINNAGGSEITGIEIEYTWAATDRFMIFGSAAWLDAELDGSFEGVDVTGNRPDNVPEWTATLAAIYSLPLSSGAVLSFRADYQGRSDVNIGPYENPNTVKNAIDKYGARVSWTSPAQKWELALWGKNLSNEIEIVAMGPDAIVEQHPTLYAPPRMWGAAATYFFR